MTIGDPLIFSWTHILVIHVPYLRKLLLMFSPLPFSLTHDFFDALTLPRICMFRPIHPPSHDFFDPLNLSHTRLFRASARPLSLIHDCYVPTTLPQTTFSTHPPSLTYVWSTHPSSLTHQCFDRTTHPLSHSKLFVQIVRSYKRMFTDIPTSTIECQVLDRVLCKLSE